MDFKINDQELEALYGLPYLCQIIYLRALRQYMNYSTGIVGIHRGISYQSLREQAYIAPHPGYKSEMPSESQVRRAIERLITTGLLARKSVGKKLIVECLLASKDKFDQMEVVSKQSGLVSRKNNRVIPQFSVAEVVALQQVGNSKQPEVVTPPETGRNINKNTQAARSIPSDFKPNLTTIKQARFMQYNNAECPRQLAKFIAYHKSKGTVSCDWDAEYFYWVLSGKQNQGGKSNVGDRNSVSKPSAVDRVAKAHAHYFTSFINSEERNDQQERHCMVVDGDD